MSNGRGQPTKYREEYCQILINHMAKGFSFESFAGAILVHKDTLYEWVKTHEEFSEAKKIALEVSRLWWETKAIENVVQESTPGYTRSLNTAAWIFNMKNRFGWSDRTEVTTKKDGDESDDKKTPGFVFVEIKPE